jgi:outer membrane receptor for ferrienterochelin and colicin
MKKGFIVLLLLSLVFVSVFAEGEEAMATDTAAAVTAEDLLFLDNPMVFVASKMEESAATAPGSIKVYSADDMTRLGVHTLGELASLTVGMGIETALGESGYQVRELSSGRSGFENSRVLILIDGMPVNFGRSLYGWNGEELSLDFSARVEFLKGPSSALYGRSAFLGVINIVSKQAPKENGVNANVRLTGGIHSEIKNTTRFDKKVKGFFAAKKDDVELTTYAAYSKKNPSGKRFENNWHYANSTADLAYSTLLILPKRRPLFPAQSLAGNQC